MLWRDIKRFLVGRPLETLQLGSERLNKVVGLAVLSSDALSSVAYATEAMLLVLMAAGAAGTDQALRVGGFILLLLVIVVASYRQTVYAYPQGGGAYFVAKENLGTTFGLVAGAALLVDYTLTVAVSIAAGVDAITSAFPGLLAHRVALGLVAIGVIAFGNLRGIRESGAIFSVPTYFFISMFGLMLVVNIVHPLGYWPGVATRGQGALELVSSWLLLRAFSSGSAALAGGEAVRGGGAAVGGRRRHARPHPPVRGGRGPGVRPVAGGRGEAARDAAGARLGGASHLLGDRRGGDRHRARHRARHQVHERSLDHRAAHHPARARVLRDPSPLHLLRPADFEQGVAARLAPQARRRRPGRGRVEEHRVRARLRAALVAEHPGGGRGDEPGAGREAARRLGHVGQRRAARGLDLPVPLDRAPAARLHRSGGERGEARLAHGRTAGGGARPVVAQHLPQPDGTRDQSGAAIPAERRDYE